MAPQTPLAAPVPSGAPAGRGLWAALTAAIAFATFGAGVFVGSVVLGRDDPDDGREARRVTSDPPRSPAPSPSASLPPGACTYLPELESGNIDVPGMPPATGVVRTGNVQATLRLAQGPVRMELFAGRAPCTVHSFRFLARSGFYDASSCHRLTQSDSLSVLQCGDPSATGAGGPGYRYADENLTGATYRAGTVAMANAGPATNGSQFFIVYADSRLPPNYTVFGRVTAGMDVLRAIARAGSTPPVDGKPNLDVRIRGVEIG